MPFKVQRVPRGLSELLNLFGGETPRDLATEIHGSLETLQFYGTTQLQSGFTSGVVVEGGSSGISLGNAWTVLFGVTGTIAKTATMTALRASLVLNRRTQFDSLLFTEALGPFGATETGNANFGGRLPYPLICPPGTAVACRLDILGTDANATVSVFAEYGLLG